MRKFIKRLNVFMGIIYKSENDPEPETEKTGL